MTYICFQNKIFTTNKIQYVEKNVRGTGAKSNPYHVEVKVAYENETYLIFTFDGDGAPEYANGFIDMVYAKLVQ